MSWRTRAPETCPAHLYPTAAGSTELCEHPLLLPEWETPAGFNPVLPLASGPSLPLPATVLPLLTVGGKVFPNLDPNVGAFVQDLPLPAGFIGGRPGGESQYLPANTRPWTVGESVIGMGPNGLYDSDAIGIEGDPIQGELP